MMEKLWQQLAVDNQPSLYEKYNDRKPVLIFGHERLMRGTGGERVLVMVPFVDIATYDGFENGGFKFYRRDGAPSEYVVTHWMPIENPQGEAV